LADLFLEALLNLLLAAYGQGGVAEAHLGELDLDDAIEDGEAFGARGAWAFAAGKARQGQQRCSRE
jgi:hypothetical protein